MVLNKEKWFHSKIDGFYYCTSKTTKSKLFMVASCDPFVGYRLERLVELPDAAIIKEIAEKEPLKLRLILIAKKELAAKGVKNVKQIRP